MGRGSHSWTQINLAESPLDVVRLMRAVSDGALTPSEAVEDYHDALRRKGLKPSPATFAADREITEPPSCMATDDMSPRRGVHSAGRSASTSTSRSGDFPSRTPSPRS